MPFIPLESEIDALIAGCGRKTSTVLQLLKETGMRIGEATPLTWIDVDLERKTITVNEPEKAGTPRRIKISTSSWQCLNNYRKQLNAYYAEQRQSAHAAPFESKENDLQQNFRIQGCCTFGSTRSAIGKPQWNIIKPKISCK